MLHIGGDNSILDNVWCWVADHYADDNTSVGFDKAKCKIGLNVSGDNVIAYGVFAEHTYNRNVLWTGDNGKVYMFQSEFNYYIPSNFDTSNFVSYEIKGDNVKKHTLYGAGAYSYFALKPDNGATNGPMAKAGFMWDKDINVDYQNLVTVFLNGYGGISHIFNDQGISVKYSVDPITNHSSTQIAIACNNGNKNCGCYPSCDNTKSTCDQDLYRCKPIGDHVCSSDIVNSLKCAPDHNWTISPYKGCFTQTDAQKNTNYCQLW